MLKKCTNKRVKSRHRVNLALDKDIWDRFQPTLKDDWQGSFNSWVERAMECYMHESCDECPYAEEEGQEKAGIVKVAIKED